MKPFEKEELMARIFNLLATRRLLQQKYSQLASHSDPPDTLTKEDEFLLKIKNTVLENLDKEEFSVNELARAIAMSRSQLHRKIKALTGLSTSLFIRSIRLQKAKTLLEKGILTVGEVAYEVGFKSPIYFSQVYKEMFGENPSATRK